MCGVIGILGKNEVATEIYNGMVALQHRGQDAAGILTFSEKVVYGKKAKGLVKNIFSSDDLIGFKGELGVGHTRYRTQGSVSERDAHPFLISSTYQVAVVQNGNVVNYQELKEMLKQKGVFLDSTSDTEIIARIIAHEYELSRDVAYSIRRLMEKIKGSYSVVCAIQNVGLVGFRDPNGIRPLLIGKKDDAYCIASETATFHALGYQYLRDVEPGEAIYIDMAGELHSYQIAPASYTPCMFEWIYFARADSKVSGRSVYNARLKLGKLLAQQWTREVDVVIPVPDTARTAAIKFAEELGLRYREGLLKNRYTGRTFIMPTQSSREDAVKVKLSPIIASVNKKRIVLFDDSIVRGTTMKGIIKLIRNAGAVEVHVVSTCPPITHPCFYGVDMRDKNELIAANKTVEEIREHLGADSLTYQPIEHLYTAMKKETLCTACLTGEYPVDIPDQKPNACENIMFKG